MRRANPGKLNYASQGSGATSHLTAELFKSMAGGLQITHVPYKGSAPALADLLGGQVDMMFDNLGVSLPHVKSGKLRALAVASTRRFRSLPDVPALAETLPGFESVAWFGIVGPPKTPAAIARESRRRRRGGAAQPGRVAPLERALGRSAGHDPRRDRRLHEAGDRALGGGDPVCRGKARITIRGQGHNSFSRTQKRIAALTPNCYSQGINEAWITSGTPCPPTDLIARSTSFRAKRCVVTFSKGKRFEASWARASSQAL